MEAPRYEDQPGESELSAELRALDQVFIEQERTNQAIEGFFMWHNTYLGEVARIAHDLKYTGNMARDIIRRGTNEIVENFSAVINLVNESSASPSQALETTATLLSDERVARGAAFDELSAVKSYDPELHTPEFFSDKLIELSCIYPDPAERHSKLMELYSLDLFQTSAETVLQHRKEEEFIGDIDATMNEFLLEDTKKVAKDIGYTALNAAEMAGIIILAAGMLAQEGVNALINKFQQKRRRRT
jgi:hypothetical protein